jgi:hypothetical protein
VCPVSTETIARHPRFVSEAEGISGLIARELQR